MEMEKITRNLQEALDQNTWGQAIEVVIELENVRDAVSAAGLSRTEAIARKKEQFEDSLKPVAQLIKEKGGDILGAAWINQTVKARVSTHCLEDLSNVQAVQSIDVPHSLSSESF